MEKETEKLEGEGKIEDVQNSSRFSSDTSRVQRERRRSVIVEMVGVVCVWEAAPKRAGPQVDGCQLALGTVTVREILWRGTHMRTTWTVTPLRVPCPISAPTQTGRRASKLTITMRKSSQHQALVKYLRNPKATHFRIISRIKMNVKILSVHLSNRSIWGRLEMLTSSNIWKNKAQPWARVSMCRPPC